MTNDDPPVMWCPFCGAKFFMTIDGASKLYLWHVRVLHPNELAGRAGIPLLVERPRTDDPVRS